MSPFPLVALGDSPGTLIHSNSARRHREAEFGSHHLDVSGGGEVSPFLRADISSWSSHPSCWQGINNHGNQKGVCEYFVTG